MSEYKNILPLPLSNPPQPKTTNLLECYFRVFIRVQHNCYSGTPKSGVGVTLLSTIGLNLANKNKLNH